MGAVLGPCLTFAFNQPFVRCDFLQGHRAAGAKFLCGDANLGAQAKLCAVGEAGWSVPVDAGSIDVSLELTGGLFVLRNDGFAKASSIEPTVLTASL